MGATHRRRGRLPLGICGNVPRRGPTLKGLRRRDSPCPSGRALRHLRGNASASAVTARLAKRKRNDPHGEDEWEQDDRPAKKLCLNRLARLFFHFRLSFTLCFEMSYEAGTSVSWDVILMRSKPLFSQSTRSMKESDEPTSQRSRRL